jgi:hypothetical protein
MIEDAAQADVVLALAWPPYGESLLPAIAGLAGRQAVIVFEAEATSGWPALDPQSWQPRAGLPDPPIVVSVDARDEEHSLMLAIRRLASDAMLRAALATAGHAWWHAHGTLEHTIAEWHAAIDAALAAPPATPPADLQDGSANARRLLDQLGVSVDFLTT